jgi:hypothetical protein
MNDDILHYIKRSESDFGDGVATVPPEQFWREVKAERRKSVGKNGGWARRIGA